MQSFKKKPHNPKTSDLKAVQPWMIIEIPSLSLKDKICSSCRKALREIPGSSKQCEDLNIEEVQQIEECDDLNVEQETDIGEIDDNLRNLALKSLNECLINIGEEPFNSKRMDNLSYVRNKWNRSVLKISGKVLNLKDEVVPSPSEWQNQYVQKLKTAYVGARDERFREFILTLVPENWSMKRTAEVFESASLYKIKKSRKSDPAEACSSTIREPHGSSLKPDVISTVKDFYCSDDISRIMPGRKDATAMKVSNVINKYYGQYCSISTFSG